MTTVVTQNLTVSHPSADALSRGPAAAVELANAFVVDSAETFELASDELRQIKARLDKLDAQRKGITKPLDETKKAVMDLFRGPVDALEGAERVLKGKMLTFQQEEKRRADEDRLARERAATAERERLELEAKALEAKGQDGEAYAVRSLAEMVVAPPTAAAPAAAVRGVSTSSTFDFEVTDLPGLVAYVARHPDLIGLVMVDTVQLRAYVRALGQACALPGVRVFKKESIRQRK